MPFVPTREEGPKAQLIKFPEPKNVLSYLLDPRQLISSSSLLAKTSPSEAKDNTQSKEEEHRLLSGLIVLQAAEMDPIMRFAGTVNASGMGIGDLYQHIRMRTQTQKNIYRQVTLNICLLV